MVSQRSAAVSLSKKSTNALSAPRRKDAGYFLFFFHAASQRTKNGYSFVSVQQKQAGYLLISATFPL